MRLKSFRLLFQVIFLFLSIIGFAGVAKTGLIFPYFFCNASPGAVCVCPIWALEHASIILSSDFKTALTMLVYLFGFLGVIGFAVGRTFCGWACPIGLTQDFAKQFRGKIKIQLNILFGLIIMGWVMIGAVFLFPSMITGYIGTAGIMVEAVALFGILTKLDNIIINISVVFILLISLISVRLYIWDQPGIREIWFFILLVLLFVSALTIVHKYVLSRQTIIRDTKFYDQRYYHYIKYIILILIVLTSFFLLDKWFTNIDPIGGLTAGLPVLMYESDKWNVMTLLWVKFVLLALFFWLILITYRGFWTREVDYQGQGTGHGAASIPGRFLCAVA